MPAQGNALGLRVKKNQALKVRPHFLAPLRALFFECSKGVALGWQVAGPLALGDESAQERIADYPSWMLSISRVRPKNAASAMVSPRFITRAAWSVALSTASM